MTLLRHILALPSALIFSAIALTYPTIVAAADSNNHVSDKSPLFSGLDIDEAALYSALPYQAPASLTKWAPNGVVPKRCKDFAESGNHCAPADLEVFDVEYDDCKGNPWTLCRCHNASWTVGDLAEMLGRMPVKARQYTRTYVSFLARSDEPGNAYSSGPDTAFIDTDKGVKSPTVAIHEMAHTIDFYYNQMHGSSAGLLSASADFVAAIAKDQCVPDGYAKTTDIEDFAQLTVLSSYDTNAGGLQKYGNASCLMNQLKWVESTIGETLKVGGTCDFTWEDDEKVCIKGEGECDEKRAVVGVPRKREMEVPVLKVRDFGVPEIVDHVHDMLPSPKKKRYQERRRRWSFGI